MNLTPEEIDALDGGELAGAAAMLAEAVEACALLSPEPWQGQRPMGWPDKVMPWPGGASPRELVSHAIALLVAEGQRLDRAADVPEPPALAVEVKPLVWGRRYKLESTEHADTILGQYCVWDINGNAYWMAPNERSGSLADGGLEAAKAAAQTDYERRILSAITDRPAQEVRNEALDNVISILDSEIVIARDVGPIGYATVLTLKKLIDAIRALKGGVV